MPGEEKTEAATPKKRLEMRRKGQVCKSNDLSASITFLAILVALHNLGGGISSRLMSYMTGVLSSPETTTLTRQALMMQAYLMGMTFVHAIGPIIMTGMIIGIVANILQTGFLVSVQAMHPDFNRINPLNGAKRYLSSQGLFETAKALLKIFIVGYIAYSTIYASYPRILVTIREDVPTILGYFGDLIYSIALRTGMFLFILSAVDYGWQRYSFEKSSRMTKEEVRQENKQAEGDPQIKSRIRARMRQLAKRRMMEAVPTADVVITNPTHFSVALKYDVASMGAPRVVAKGVDIVAKRIREIAVENDVPIVENPPLARSLWRNVDIDAEVPGDMFAAVAEVLAYVYRLNAQRSHV